MIIINKYRIQKKIVPVLLIMSVITSCTSSIKKPNDSNTEKTTIESSEKKAELDRQKKVMNFVKLANLPDSINLDINNVFYGDFNGNNKEDFACPIVNIENSFYGLAIIHNDSIHSYKLIEMGDKINISNNPEWVNRFDIIPKGQYIAPTLVNKKTGYIIGPNKSKVFKLLGDGITLLLGDGITMTVKQSNGGGILFWNGKDYDWYHIE